MNSFQGRRFLFLVLGIALLARLFFFVIVYLQEPHKFDLVDIDGYVLISQTLLSRGEFSRGQVTDFALDFERTPAYPFFLAALSWVFQGKGAWVTFIQLLVGSGSVGLAYLLACELKFQQPAPILAGFLLALDPISILLAHYPLTETLFTLLLLAALTLFAHAMRNPSPLPFAFSGVLFALATLTRPVVQFLPLCFVLLLFLVMRGRGWRLNLRDAGIFLVAFSVLLVPWLWRNIRAGGLYSLSTVGDINLYFYRAKAVFADAQDISQSEALRQLNSEFEQVVVRQNLNLQEREAYLRWRALSILIQHPVETTRMTAWGLARLLLDPGYTLVCAALDPHNFDDECFQGEATMLAGGAVELLLQRFFAMALFQKIVLIWAVLWMGLLYVCAFLGSRWLFREKNWIPVLILIGTVSYFVLLSAGAESLYRLRAPLIPLLTILAAGALSPLPTGCRGGHLPRLWGVGRILPTSRDRWGKIEDFHPPVRPQAPRERGMREDR